MIKTLIAIVIMVIVGATGFFGGYTYAKKGSKNSGSNFPNFQNMTSEQRQQFRANMGNGNGANGGRRLTQGGGFVGGEVIKMDDSSLTLKIPDGGSRIVFYSDSTKVMKSAEGSIKDINTGENIMATGKTNTDGSITAETLQVRPAGQTFGQNPGQDQKPADKQAPPSSN